MKLTIQQAQNLVTRMEAAEVTEVEITEADDGRLQFYVIETKVVRRPLKSLKAIEVKTEIIK